MKLSEKILALRKKVGMSQEELANEMDVSRQTVYKWETAEAQPELAKIKKLAKFFNVSFDYLMDDEIEDMDQQPENVKRIKQRRAFYTGIRTSRNQSDTDNGYVQGSRCVVAYSGHLHERKAVAEKLLRSLGATDIFFIQNDATTAFFCDRKKYVCGFYYAGQVQFVCPIENIMGFYSSEDGSFVYNTTNTFSSVGVGMGGVNSIGFGTAPGIGVLPGTEAKASLAYRDGEEMKEIVLEFSVASAQCRFIGETVEDDEWMWSAAMKGLRENLKKLQQKISFLQRDAMAILSGHTEVENVNYEIYRKKNEEAMVEYREYIRVIEAQARIDYRNHVLKKLFKWGALGVGVVLAFFLLFNCVNNMSF